jgi:hypothetical protein
LRHKSKPKQTRLVVDPCNDSQEFSKSKSNFSCCCLDRRKSPGIDVRQKSADFPKSKSKLSHDLQSSTFFVIVLITATRLESKSKQT